MKKEVFAACSGVVFALAASQPVAAQERSYVAQLNEDGKYCAQVEVRTVANIVQKRTKFRTIEQWEANGYEVSAKEE